MKYLEHFVNGVLWGAGALLGIMGIIWLLTLIGAL